MTVRRSRWKTRRVVMEQGPKTSREILRAAELGIDLEYVSDKNLLRIYLSLIRHGQIMQIPSAVRGKLAQADLITLWGRGRHRNSVLTKRGNQMFREIEEEKNKEAAENVRARIARRMKTVACSPRASLSVEVAHREQGSS